MRTAESVSAYHDRHYLRLELQFFTLRLNSSPSDCDNCSHKAPIILRKRAALLGLRGILQIPEREA